MLKFDENVESRYGITLVNDRVVRKEYSYGSRAAFDWIQKLCNQLIAVPDPMVVPVYKFETLEIIENDNRWGTYRYAYEMQRLYMLSSDEKEVITNMARRGYHAVDRDDPHPDIQDAWRTIPALVEFMNTVFRNGHYRDCHDQNFLKDEQGNYRIIDLEGFAEYPGIGKYTY